MGQEQSAGMGPDERSLMTHGLPPNSGTNASAGAAAAAAAAMGLSSGMVIEADLGPFASRIAPPTLAEEAEAAQRLSRGGSDGAVSSHRHQVGAVAPPPRMHQPDEFRVVSVGSRVRAVRHLKEWVENPGHGHPLGAVRSPSKHYTTFQRRHLTPNSPPGSFSSEGNRFIRDDEL